VDSERRAAGGGKETGQRVIAGPLFATRHPPPATRSYRPIIPSPISFAASIPAETALCACFTTLCATCCARSTTLPPRFEERLLGRLLLRPLLFEELLRLPDRLDADLLEDFRPPPLRDEAERADDPPRFRADFRPRFAPPDFRDDPLLPDFLRDLRLVAAIPVSPGRRSYARCVARNGRDGTDCGLRTADQEPLGPSMSRGTKYDTPLVVFRGRGSAVRNPQSLFVAPSPAKP
jgi:hypothetical protein